MTDRDKIEKLAVWIFEEFPLICYSLPAEFRRLQTSEKEMMKGFAAKFLNNFVPRTEHEELMADLKKAMGLLIEHEKQRDQIKAILGK